MPADLKLVVGLMRTQAQQLMDAADMIENEVPAGEVILVPETRVEIPVEPSHPLPEVSQEQPVLRDPASRTPGDSGFPYMHEGTLRIPGAEIGKGKAGAPPGLSPKKN